MESFINQAGKYALKATLLTTAAVLFILLTFSISATGSLKIIFDLLEWVGIVNLAVFLTLLLFLAFLIGKIAGRTILTKRKSRFFISYVSGLSVVILATLLSTVFSIIFQTSDGFNISEAAFIVARSLAWMLCLSFLPVIIAGSWFGNKLKAL